MRLSVSKVQEFEKCPHSFFLSNIKKEKIDILPIQLKEGVEKHDIFDKIYDKAKRLSPQLNSAHLKSEIRTLPKYFQYQQDCDNFIKFNEMIESKGSNIEPEHREIKLYSNELDFAGVIDRVDVDNEKILILDYKTGKTYPIQDYYFQLAVYVYLFEKEFKKKVTHWSIYFSHQNDFFVEPIQRDEVDKALLRIKNISELITASVNNNSFPKQPSSLCNWCVWWSNNKCSGKVDE